MVFIVGEKPFMYKREITGPKLGPSGLPWFKISESKHVIKFFCQQLARNENSDSFDSLDKLCISIFKENAMSNGIKSFARSRKFF